MRYMNRLTAGLCAALFLAFPLTAGAATAADKSQLDGLVAEALENNPEIRAALSRTEAMAELPPQVGALPNPSLSLGITNMPAGSLDLDGEERMIEIMQTFPWPGKRGLRRETAEQEAQKSRESLDLLKLRVAREVKETYYALYLAERSIEATERSRELLKNFIRIAEAKYSVGSGIQQDVLKAYVEFSRMKEKLIVHAERKAVLTAQMNYLLSRFPAVPVETAPELAPVRLEIPEEEIIARIDRAHPALRGLSADISREEAEKRLAGKEYYPDLTVSLQYGQRDDGPMEQADFLGATVKMDLPLWQGVKEDRKVAERLARVREARAQYEAERNRLVYRVRTILSEMESALEQTRLYREGILPQARASLESAVAGYQVNKVDFLTLLDNQIALLNDELEYSRAVVAHEIALAELEEVAGGKLKGEDYE